MVALFFIAVGAGALTVLSPCVLPLLPVVVGGSIAGERSAKRAMTVVASLGISVFVFTFLLKVSTVFLMVPPEAWNWLSGGILLAAGLIFLFPNLWDLIPGTAKANRDSTKLMSAGFMRQSLLGDIIVGAALGPVFTTCSPTYFIVLATVLPASLAAGVADILGYILGLSLALFAVSIAGQRLLDTLGVAADPRGWLRRAIGILLVLVGVLIGTGSFAAIEAPLYGIFDETKLELRFLPGSGQPPASAPRAAGAATTTAFAPSVSPGFLTLLQKALRYEKAPELVSPDAYLNTGGEPITLAQYRGKDVVLVDFWTYSCINCQRTLPYLTAWYSTYKDRGLVIIGVHTPEFAFEHLQGNVAAALKQFGIEYPVVLDNEYRTWNAYGNRYWPHDYVIDIDGYIVHDHAGEGDYDATEKAIQSALAERASRLAAPMPATTTVAVAPPDLSGIGSPETYFGAARNEYLGNGAQGRVGPQTLTLPSAPSANTLYLGGSWDFAGEYAAASPGATVEYRYSAKDVYFVASGLAAGTKVEVLQDGVPVGASAGADIANGAAAIGASRLYHLVHNASAGEHVLKLIIDSPGLQAYTFTFG